MNCTTQSHRVSTASIEAVQVTLKGNDTYVIIINVSLFCLGCFHIIFIILQRHCSLQSLIVLAEGDTFTWSLLSFAKECQSPVLINNYPRHKLNFASLHSTYCYKLPLSFIFVSHSWE